MAFNGLRKFYYNSFWILSVLLSTTLFTPLKSNAIGTAAQNFHLVVAGFKRYWRKQIPKKNSTEFFSDLVLIAFAINRNVLKCLLISILRMSSFSPITKKWAKKAQLEWQLHSSFRHVNLVLARLDACSTRLGLNFPQNNYHTMLILTSHAFNEKPPCMRATLY